jgi:hypothetical protein
MESEAVLAMFPQPSVLVGDGKNPEFPFSDWQFAMSPLGREAGK